MKNNYVIDKVPYDKLGALSQKDYGKIWYCHMRDFPDIPVSGSIGTKRHAQEVCDLYNLKPRHAQKVCDLYNLKPKANRGVSHEESS